MEPFGLAINSAVIQCLHMQYNSLFFFFLIEIRLVINTAISCRLLFPNQGIGRGKTKQRRER